MLEHSDLTEVVVDDYLQLTRPHSAVAVPPVHRLSSNRARKVAYVCFLRAHRNRRRMPTNMSTSRRGISSQVLSAGLDRQSPGTGKSTVPRNSAAVTDAILLSSDHIRTDARACGIVGDRSGEYGRGLYTGRVGTRVCGHGSRPSTLAQCGPSRHHRPLQHTIAAALRTYRRAETHLQS